MSIEVIERDGVRYAEVIRANAQVSHTRFYSPASSSMQFGLLAHEKGFFEAPHVHKPIQRSVDDLQQMFVVQRGVVAVEFYASDGEMFADVRLEAGDAILLVHGGHAVRAIEDFQCVSVKQGPFLGAENDKVEINVKAK